jgi:hypothetical protein
MRRPGILLLLGISVRNVSLAARQKGAPEAIRDARTVSSAINRRDHHAGYPAYRCDPGVDNHSALAFRG